MTHCRARSRSALVTALLVAALMTTFGLASRAHAAGTVLYVSPSGSDANSGTSVGTPLQTIQKALDLAQPGTTINLAEGVYRQALVTRVAGTAGAPITIKGPTTGRDKATVYSVGGRVFSINHSYYTLDGFTIDGQPSIARSEYPTRLADVRAWKDSVQSRAINSKLVYVGVDTTVADIAGTTISNMFLNGSGGECVRFRDRAANSLIVNSVIQYCGVLGQGNDVDQYKYHNSEGIYIGTSPKSTDQPMAANDTSNNIVVRDSTINTFGSECFEVKENAHHNRLENTTCGNNDEPSTWQGSNIELRGDHNTVVGATVSNSRSWNMKLASDSATYDRGGNTAQRTTFSGAATYAIINRQAGSGPFCGDTFAGSVSDPSGGTIGTPTASCVDTTPPTAPTALAATATSPTAVALTWTAATDDVAVTSYDVLRNGALIGSSSTPSFTDSAATASTAYSYTVVAKDGAGNASPASAPAAVTTPVPADTTPPAVTTRSPADKATGIAVGNSVTATFSEPVLGVATDTFLLNAGTTNVAGKVDFNATTRVATLTPTAALAANTQYTATLTNGIKDAANNPLAAVSWTFTTVPAAAPVDTTAPTVTSRNPGVNATGVATTSPVTATFSEAVQGTATAGAFTLKTGTTTVGATVSYDAAGRTATLKPTAVLAANTQYTASLTNGIKDLAGNPLATTPAWSFITAAAADRTAPTVTSRTPSSGATSVSRTGSVTVTFSEPVNGVSNTTFVLKTSGGSTVAATVTRNGTGNQWILKPNTTLSSRATYTVTVTGGSTAVRDVAGNALTKISWSFTTAR
jgi:hypothetical protein